METGLMVVDNQAKFDAFDQKKHGKVADLRPGDTVEVIGTLPCGKRGRVERGVVLNSCLTVGAAGDQALVATVTYGRRWFGAQGSIFKVVKLVARKA